MFLLPPPFVHILSQFTLPGLRCSHQLQTAQVTKSMKHPVRSCHCCGLKGRRDNCKHHTQQQAVSRSLNKEIGFVVQVRLSERFERATSAPGQTHPFFVCLACYVAVSPLDQDQGFAFGPALWITHKMASCCCFCLFVFLLSHCAIHTQTNTWGFAISKTVHCLGFMYRFL